MTVKDYKELIVWQNGIDIVDMVYLVTNNFPKNELFGLASQMRRATISIPSNIAEGFVRQYTKEYIQFLHISLGSCAELDTQIVIARRRKYTDDKALNELAEIIYSEMRMLSSLIKKL